MPDDLLTVDKRYDYTLKTIDVNSGAIKTVRQVGGKIIQGPVITGDKVSVTIETPTGKVGSLNPRVSFLLLLV